MPNSMNHDPRNDNHNDNHDDGEYFDDKTPNPERLSSCARREEGEEAKQREREASERRDFFDQMKQPHAYHPPFGGPVLSVPEVREPDETRWGVVGRVLVRSMLKALCEVGYAFFDTQPLRQPKKK